MRAALGMIHNKIIHSLGNPSNAVVGVVASEPGEGATTLALKLALYAADGGRETFLLDLCADREMTRLLKKEGQEGLSNLAAGEVRFADILCRTDVGGLSLVPAGTISPFDFAQFDWQNTLEEARRNCDLAYVDLPAVADSTLAMKVMRSLDGLVLVVAAHLTRKEVFHRTKNDLERYGGEKIIGVVLNGRRYFIPDALYHHL
jgi:Mrp family chromosome partitioning ATPase